VANLEGLQQATASTESKSASIKLADQSIDSKEYIKRYLAYTETDGVQYRSLIQNRPQVLQS